MTDAELIEKKLAEIETRLSELRAETDPGRLRGDVKEKRFVLHTLQMAIQGALDVASHIVSDDRLGEPDTYRELFTVLERHRWITAVVAGRLRDMAGFRNVLVHGYAELDLAVVEEILTERLEDLEEFGRQIRARLPE